MLSKQDQKIEGALDSQSRKGLTLRLVLALTLLGGILVYHSIRGYQ